METASSSTNALQDVASINSFLNIAATETVPLFEHLEFEFLLEYDVFAPAARRRTRVHKPPDLFRGFLHCYYVDVYGTRPVTRELQHGLVWYFCGLEKPASRDTVDRFLTDLEHVIDDVLKRLVEQAACRGLLDSTYSIDPTHVEAIQYNNAASCHYDPTAEEHYYAFGCTIVSTGAKIPIAAEFTQRKQADQETGMRVTDVQLKLSILDETYTQRTGVERTNDAVKHCGLGHVRARGRIHALTEVYVALCLRLVVAITNYERGNNPGWEKL